MTFVRAQRQRVWLKMAVTGPSGSGKTYGALRLAFGLGERIAFIDTENSSGSLYADLGGGFDVHEIAAPYTVAKYTAAIGEAVAGGYDVLIIDSLSHVWAGDGGLLDQKSAKDSRGGSNSFTNWADISKVYEQFKSALLHSPIHVIGTMRSKQDYVIEQGQNGKQTPRKVGMAPIQREGFEYEFTTVLDVDMTHTAATSKDRTGLFTDEISQITEQHGRRLAEWLAGGAAPPETAPHFTSAQERQPLAPASRTPAPNNANANSNGNANANSNGNANANSNGSGTPACTSCGKALTKAQNELSIRNYGAALCPGCQRNPQREQRPAEATPAALPAPALGPGESPWDKVVQIMRGYDVGQKQKCFDRFQHRYGTRNVKALTEPHILEALRYLETGEWPHEAAFRTAQEQTRAGEEDDPFAEDAEAVDRDEVAALIGG